MAEYANSVEECDYLKQTCARLRAERDDAISARDAAVAARDTAFAARDAAVAAQDAAMITCDTAVSSLEALRGRLLPQAPAVPPGWRKILAAAAELGFSHAQGDLTPITRIDYIHGRKYPHTVTPLTYYTRYNITLEFRELAAFTQRFTSAVELLDYAAAVVEQADQIGQILAESLHFKCACGNSIRVDAKGRFGKHSLTARHRGWSAAK
jgi:hypothetical protein